MKKYIKPILIYLVMCLLVYLCVNIYVDRIEKIENGEITVVSESYMDR